MNVNDISSGTKQYLLNLVDSLSNNDFTIGILSPLVKIGIENNFNKITKILNLISDENGNIDIEKLVNDIIKSSLNGKSMTYNISPVGEIVVGNDAIRFNILNKYIKFDSNDFIKLKNYLIENYGT